MFFVLHLVTAMSKGESCSLPFVPKLARPRPYMIYAVSFSMAPGKTKKRSIGYRD